MSDISIISAILVVASAFLAGLEGISTTPIPTTVACTLNGLATGNPETGLCLVDLFE